MNRYAFWITLLARVALGLVTIAAGLYLIFTAGSPEENLSRDWKVAIVTSFTRTAIETAEMMLINT